MNPYIGDRQLDPPEEPEIPQCQGCQKCCCDEELEDCMPDMRDPGEPNDYPE